MCSPESRAISFAVLLPDTTDKGAAVLGEKLSFVVNLLNIDFEGSDDAPPSGKLGIYFGIETIIPDRLSKTDVFLLNAEAALEEAIRSREQ